jgi:cell division protein FtsB
MTYFLIVVLAVLALAVFAAIKLNEKNKSLTQSVATLASQVSELAKPKPFGLKGLEAVGKMLNGLTGEVVRVAYAAAAVCERPNTVGFDIADALDQEAQDIDSAENTIESLQAQLASTRDYLGTLEARAAELVAIGKLLPAK